ncbi:MAG: ATP-binding cassette domain-containing protein [Pirellulales bacterium]|nr:ATP-binding cassette domain-containing protein [Pirellulales bacterium]
MMSEHNGFAVRVADVQHSFGEGELKKQVLFDNRLEVARGEIVIMTGPSGSGKTTLLTLIGTLRTVQEGSLEVLGRELRGASPDELIALRRELGFIFQAHNLFESLTARQNVKMALELFPAEGRRSDDLSAEILTRLGLGQRISYKPGSLSGGQKQRVAIARGLAHKPKLILADEPTAALDEKSGREVVTLFQELVKTDNCTIIMVTHDNRILDVADRIVNLVDGRIRSNVLVKESAMICDFLHACPVFGQLTPKTLGETADRMTLERFAVGAVITRQGDPGDKFYVVRSGRVDILVDSGSGQKSVATLGKGDFFGEAALLTGEPRNATVVAREDLEVYSLGNDDFQAVIRASATFEEELRKALFARQ